MRALTLHQPWASLVAAGVKQIETRSWSTSYRGPLAIHAAKKEPDLWGYEDDCCYGEIFGPDAGPPVGGAEVLVQYAVHIETDDWHMYVAPDFDRLPMPLGAVVATAELVDVVPVNAWRADPRGDGWGYAVLNAAGQFNGACVWVHENDSLAPRLGEWQSDVSDQLPFGDFTPGRFAWLLGNVRALVEPVPARGYQGLWTPDYDLVEAVAE